MNAKDLISNLIKDDLIPIVESTRKHIESLYDVTSEDYKDFRGLCHITCSELINNIKARMLYKYSINDLHIHTIHGEQRHLPRIKSEDWYYQHTWIYMKLGSHIIYIDPTSGQFKDLYDDIPDYYISTIPPKWYVCDKKNPIFGNKLLRCIDKKIRIRKERPNRNDNENKYFHIGIIEYIYYDIWGWISDKIHSIIK